MTVWCQIASSLRETGTCALVTVAEADGSTPRDNGARMVVREDGSFYGTIGGGTLEFEAIRSAKNAISEGKGRIVLKNISLGPDLGQCCGGRAVLAIEVLTRTALQLADRLADAEGGGETFSTSAIVEDGTVGPRAIVMTPFPSAFELSTDVANGRRVLHETFGQKCRSLYLFGAGHVGKALVLALAPLPFSVTWIDSRKDQFPTAAPPNVKKVCLPDPATALDSAPDNAFVLAMTHSHALDEDIMARALLAQRFAYCGVIGSKTKRARFRNRLKQRGLPEPVLANMICPVGRTTIKSKHPAAIAAGIATDLLERDEHAFQQAVERNTLAQQ